MLANYAISFMLTPFITEHLGIETYGFVSIANNFVNYFGIATIAITAFMVRYISIAYHSGDMKTANQYFSSSVFCCTLLSGVILLITLFLVWKLQYILVIPDNILLDVKILFAFTFVTFTLNLGITPFSSAFYIKDRLDYSTVFRIISYVIQALSLVLFFSFLSPKVWYVGLGALIAGFSLLVLFFFASKKLTPELSFELSDVSKHKILDLIKNGIWDAFNQLGNVLNSGLDLLIANLLLTALETGEISVAKTMATMFASLLSMISHLLQPSLIKAYSTGDLEFFKKTISKSMRLCGFFSNLVFAGFFALGIAYYKLWLPYEDSNILFILTIISFANYVTDGLMRPVYYIGTLTTKNKIPCFVTIGGGVLNVISMLILIKFTSIGIYSVVITTAIIMIGINLLFNPIYGAKCVGISSLFFYKIIMRSLLSCAIMAAAFWGTSFLIKPNSWITLILVSLLLTLEGIIIYFALNINKNEAKSVFYKLFKKADKE